MNSTPQYSSTGQLSAGIHSVFISYASPDQARVIPFYDYLVQQGFNVWIDCKKLKPGQNWDFEIKRELDKASFVLVFVSQNSCDRRGYLQRELRLALDKRNEKLIDDIYLIPVLLDDTPIPSQFHGIQHIKASETSCYDQIVDAIAHQQGRLGEERNEIQKKEGIVWETRKIHESWDGIPGYDVQLDWLEFRSERFSNITEISEYIKGRLLSNLFKYREHKVAPEPTCFNYGQDSFIRTNTYDAHCGEPILNGRIISIQYSVQFYGAGAAHGIYRFDTYNFLLEPIVLIDSFSRIFKEPDKALPIVQGHTRNALYSKLLTEVENRDLYREWIDKGTSNWEDFRAFTFTNEGIDILFGAYQVAAFAYGPQGASLPFTIFAPLMRTEYVSAMSLERFVL